MSVKCSQVTLSKEKWLPISIVVVHAQLVVALYLSDVCVVLDAKI